MIKIVAKKLVKEGKVQEFKEIVGELVEKSLAEEGNVFYSINVSTKNPRMLAFIECWRDQEALDIHHAAPMMGDIARLREKYDLHMKAERYVTDEEGFSANDKKFIKN